MLYSLPDRQPEVPATAFVAENATVIGSARFGAHASVWFNAVVRADNDWIIVGDRTNIQDGAVLHTDAGIVLELGSGVTVGHKAMLHGCRIGSHSLVGINSVILNHAEIGENCLIGANALVTEGKKIPPGSLVLGSPAKVVRSLTPEEVKGIQKSAEHYVQKISLYRQHLKPFG